MSGILVTEKLIVMMEGQAREFPLFNTRAFFENSFCFAVKRKGRFLYYPCSRSRDGDTYPYVIGVKNNYFYFFCSTYKDSLTNCKIRIKWYRTWVSQGFYTYEIYNITINASGGLLAGFSFGYSILLDGDNYFFDENNQRIENFILKPGQSKSIRTTYDSSIIIEPYPYLQITAICDIASNTNVLSSGDLLGKDGDITLDFNLQEN